MLIRSARTGEEDRVLVMLEWLFAPPASTPVRWDPQRARRALTAAIASDGVNVLVAEDEAGGLMGLCTAYLDLDSIRFGLRCWVEDLVVDPGQRSRGVGAQLLAAARDWARERGATHLELDTAEQRLDAQRFYERERPDRRSMHYSWEL